MKYIVFLAFLVFAVGCDKEEIPLPANYGKHYFYVENTLDREIEVNFNTTSDLCDVLPDSVAINRYMDVSISGHQTALVRVFIGDAYKQSLNCFYYSAVIFADPFSPDCWIAGPNHLSKSVWDNRNWRYENLNEWESSYMMTVTEGLMDSVF